MGHTAVVQALLAHGVISEEDRGWAVRYAAEHDHLAVLKFLLANGFVISQGNRDYVVMLAQKHGYSDITEMLLGIRYAYV